MARTGAAAVVGGGGAVVATTASSSAVAAVAAAEVKRTVATHTHTDGACRRVPWHRDRHEQR
jgi:hypothetical protein